MYLYKLGSLGEKRGKGEKFGYHPENPYDSRETLFMVERVYFVVTDWSSRQECSFAKVLCSAFA